MNKYLLDTNIISYLRDINSIYYDAISQKLLSISEEDELCISVLSLYEIEFGVALANTNKAKTLLQETRMLAESYFQVLPISVKGAEEFGKLKADYLNKIGIKKQIAKRNDIDFVLASIAIAENAILISHDGIFEELGKINSNLKYENWTRE